MSRKPLARAFVSSVMTSGCAWSYGASAQYVQATDGTAAVSANVHGAVGLGAARDAVMLRADLGLGYTPTAPSGPWVTGMQRILYVSLPRPGEVGYRLGVGGFTGGPRRRADFVGGPLVSGELLIPLRASAPAGEGYTATLLGIGVQAMYDLADEVSGPLFGLTVTLSRDGILPFGNPPPPRLRSPALVVPTGTEIPSSGR